MFHDDILISYCKYIKTKNLIWTTLKAIFSICIVFLHAQIPDFQIVVSRPNIVRT